MLIQMKNQDGTLTSEGKALTDAGLGFLPDSFNVDDGLVGKAESEAIMAHPSLDNVAWHEFGIIAAARQFASDHPEYKPTAPLAEPHEIAAKHMARLYPASSAAALPVIVALAAQTPIPVDAVSLPSAEDLDAVAHEEEIKHATE